MTQTSVFILLINIICLKISLVAQRSTAARQTSLWAFIILCSLKSALWPVRLHVLDEKYDNRDVGETETIAPWSHSGLNTLCSCHAIFPPSFFCMRVYHPSAPHTVPMVEVALNKTFFFKVSHTVPGTCLSVFISLTVMPHQPPRTPTHPLHPHAGDNQQEGSGAVFARWFSWPASTPVQRHLRQSWPWPVSEPWAVALNSNEYKHQMNAYREINMNHK